MSSKKRRGRIRQTRTEWQKTFDPYPELIQTFSWPDRLPELLHISFALIESTYEQVKKDFFKIADFVNSGTRPAERFHFNLSHTIRIIRNNPEVLDQIFETSFRSAFEQLIPLYHDLFEVKINFEVKPDIKLLFKAYKQILDGRSDTSILSKYIMVQYFHGKNEDVFGVFNFKNQKEVLDPMNVSRIMSIFPISVGQSQNLDLNLCEDIWMYNYYYLPPIHMPDSKTTEEEQFAEFHIQKLTDEFRELYAHFKKFNLVAVYPPFIAEINMGFIARIANLSLDAVDLVKNHKGEIAEMVFRTVLESFIVGSWLLKRKDIELHKRFRDFSTGRERFFGEKISGQTKNEKIKKGAEKLVEDTIKEDGARSIEIAKERGDIFEVRLDQMADELWGNDNMYYFLYKRSSEVIHGQWRVIAKYHLSKSFNPTHNGLYFYNENTNRYAGLVPAFTCLGLATDFLLTMLEDFSSEQTKQLENSLHDFRKRQWDLWMTYFKKYILPGEDL